MRSQPWHVIPRKRWRMASLHPRLEDPLFGAACMAHVGIGSPYDWSSTRGMRAVSRVLSLNIEVP
jgi:hypothetical protein